VAFSADGSRILSRSTDHAVKVWDANKGQEILSLKSKMGEVVCVALSPDGKCIAGGCGKGSVRGPGFQAPDVPGDVKVWDADTGQETFTLKGHTTQVNSVAFSADGKRIVSSSNDQTVKVWDADAGREILTLKGHTGVVRNAAFSADGKRIVSGGVFQGRSNPGQTRRNTAGELRVWNAETGAEILTIKERIRPITSVAFSPDGKRIVTGSGSGTPAAARVVGAPPPSGELQLWDAVTGQDIRTIKDPTRIVYDVAFSADGKFIVSVSRNGSAYELGEVHIWDAETGQQVFTPERRTTSTTCGTFSPHGKRIASGSPDGTVRVWDFQTGRVAGPARQER
jgi:WD40 repeat protein